MGYLKDIYDIFIKPKTVEPRFWGNVVLFPIKVIAERLDRLAEEAEDARFIADIPRQRQQREAIFAAEKDRTIRENRMTEEEKSSMGFVSWITPPEQILPVEVLLRTHGRQAAIDACVKNIESGYLRDLETRPVRADPLGRFLTRLPYEMEALQRAHGPARVEALLGVDVQVALDKLHDVRPTKSLMRSVAKAHGAWEQFLHNDNVTPYYGGNRLFHLTVTEVAAVALWRFVMERELGIPLRPLGTAEEIGIDPARHAEIVTALEHYEPTTDQFARYRRRGGRRPRSG